MKEKEEELTIKLGEADQKRRKYDPTYFVEEMEEIYPDVKKRKRKRQTSRTAGRFIYSSSAKFAGKARKPSENFSKGLRNSNSTRTRLKPRALPGRVSERGSTCGW